MNYFDWTTLTDKQYFIKQITALRDIISQQSKPLPILLGIAVVDKEFIMKALQDIIEDLEVVERQRRIKAN